MRRRGQAVSFPLLILLDNSVHVEERRGAEAVHARKRSELGAQSFELLELDTLKVNTFNLRVGISWSVTGQHVRGE